MQLAYFALRLKPSVLCMPIYERITELEMNVLSCFGILMYHVVVEVVVVCTRTTDIHQ